MLRGPWWTQPRGPMASDRTTVLLVEDDQNIVDLVRSNLIARAHDVVVSKDGLDAVAMLEANEPDAVLLDLMLPGIDGFELCRELRERSSVGIIVLSARRAETDKVRASRSCSPASTPRSAAAGRRRWRPRRRRW